MQPKSEVDAEIINVEDFCRRFSLIYGGAISDVLGELGYRQSGSTA
jgi:hypothetical protein